MRVPGTGPTTSGDHVARRPADSDDPIADADDLAMDVAFELCNVAIFTVTPPMLTGSRISSTYGLSVPVRPTFTPMFEQRRLRFAGAELEGHCPARIAPDASQALLQLEFRPILTTTPSISVIELVALDLPAPKGELYDLLDRRRGSVVRIRR